MYTVQQLVIQHSWCNLINTSKRSIGGHFSGLAFQLPQLNLIHTHCKCSALWTATPSTRLSPHRQLLHAVPCHMVTLPSDRLNFMLLCFRIDRREHTEKLFQYILRGSLKQHLHSVYVGQTPSRFCDYFKEQINRIRGLHRLIAVGFGPLLEDTVQVSSLPCNFS